MDGQGAKTRRITLRRPLSEAKPFSPAWASYRLSNLLDQGVGVLQTVEPTGPAEGVRAAFFPQPCGCQLLDLSLVKCCKLGAQ